MTPLAPKLFERRFEELLEIARSRLPGLAPGWTDHNLHDPGITLLELLAWVTEAQLYSLSRTRRDERAAYAALFGLAARGPQPASGLLWPDHGDVHAPAATYARNLVLAQGALVHTVHSDTPAYRTLHKQLWLAGGIAALRTLRADGAVVDHTATNERGHVAYLPFGPHAGAHDVLAIEIACPPDGGLRPAEANGALLAVGVRADGVAQDGAAVPLKVSLRSAAGSQALQVASDTTCGFTCSGVILLELPDVAQPAQAFTLELRSPHGFPRAPRVTRIDLNVLPIRQGHMVERELHVASGLPGQLLALQEDGLEYGTAPEPVSVDVVESGEIGRWRQRARLADCGPGEAVYALDPEHGSISFGNGINGRIPAAGAQILLSYQVCDGAAGNAARNQRWMVRGIDGIFGFNPDPVANGSDASGLLDQRRAARAKWRAEHPVVTAHDLEQAALALGPLEVARAWALAPAAGLPDTGTVTLVAMRQRCAMEEAGQPPESVRWLAAVEHRLAARLPLGVGLRVRAPRYVQFELHAQVEMLDGFSAGAVETAVRQLLRERLALVDGPAPRPLGLGVTQRELSAWIRQAPGVRRVTGLQMKTDGQRTVDKVEVPRHGLPELDWGASTMTIQRSAIQEAR